MIIDVIGFNKFSYEKDGRKICGVNVFALEDIKSDFGSGKKYVGVYSNGACKPISIMDSVYPSDSFKVGTYDIDFDSIGSSRVSSCRHIAK